ncbi:hypothetical protein [Methanoregula sp. UBA64]|jgi:hypothetical protein|uniref:hypothetical protein n=1 Tax=Methanoregula sp. UBA64 TaxID=1915554 RepID=UPI0025FC5D11|nr:hypothetical protein [Methanoregula sp. UBA64]
MATQTTEQGVIAPGAIASGATYSNRIIPCTIAGETTNVLLPEPGTKKLPGGTGRTSHRRTVKNRKTRAGSHRKTKAGSARPHEIWLRPPKGTFEAAKILAAEGYIIGKTTGPAPVFDLVGRSPEQGILVKIVRPREPVRGAARVAELYLPEILLLRSYYRSPADSIELWIFSREIGLARYRVFDWGIANVTTVTKLFKTQPSGKVAGQTGQKNLVEQQTRNSP